MIVLSEVGRRIGALRLSTILPDVSRPVSGRALRDDPVATRLSVLAARSTEPFEGAAMRGVAVQHFIDDRDVPAHEFRKIRFFDQA